MMCHSSWDDLQLPFQTHLKNVYLLLAKDLGRKVERGLQTSEHVIVHLELGISVLPAAEGDLVVGSGVKVVKDHLVGPHLRNCTKISNVDSLANHPIVGCIERRADKRNLAENVVYPKSVKGHGQRSECAVRSFANKYGIPRGLVIGDEIGEEYDRNIYRGLVTAEHRLGRGVPLDTALE